MSTPTTRDQIIEAADQLFYQQGFSHTSFTDIAAVVEISRGNFYHHFKSKDQILEAVIAVRLANTRAMLKQWEAGAAHPADRIEKFIHILIANRPHIKRYGCPVGTLSIELAKLNHDSRADARLIFTLFRNWLCKQFIQLDNVDNVDDADKLAMHLLARSQGVATLANAFRDDQFIRNEVAHMSEWLARIQSTRSSDKE